MEPTQAAKIAPRREVVTLKHLKDSAGEPVNVLVLRTNQVTLMAALGALPMPAAPDETAVSRLSLPEQLEQYAYPMLEHTAFLVDAAGLPRRPSFTAEPRENAIWLGEVDVEDIVLMFEAAARLNGWLGGPAAELGFPAREQSARGEGGGASADAMDTGEGDRIPTLRLVAGGS